jgi:hypothetical protein
MTLSFTLGPAWVDQYVSSLVLLNALLGHPSNPPVPRPATPESMIQTLQQIAHGYYKPEQGSLSGGPGPLGLTLQPPALAPSQTYLAIVLNASTKTSDFASVETGGIIFEDPAWAVLAAHAIAQVPRLGAALPFDKPDLWRKLGVPIASDNADLWRRLGRVQDAARTAKYSPLDFFGAISGFLSQASQPEFRLIQVTSEQMSGLRERGVQSFGKPMRFYELFQRSAVVR